MLHSFEALPQANFVWVTKHVLLIIQAEGGCAGKAVVGPGSTRSPWKSGRDRMVYEWFPVG